MSHELEHQADGLEDSAAAAGGAGDPVAEQARPEPPAQHETWVEPHHVVAIISKRRSGKSSIANVFASRMVNQQICFLDVKKRYHVPGAYVAHGLDALRAAPKDVWLVHFVPAAAGGKAADEEWDGVFAWACEQTDLTLLADECVPMPLPATGWPPHAQKYIGQKAVDRCGMIACTGRWRGCFRDLFSHADAILIFPGGLSVDELEDAAKEMGLGKVDDRGRKISPLTELRGYLAEAKSVGDYACVMWLRNQDRFVIFQLPETVLDDAIAIEVAPK